jgi:hypothetical protein
MPNLDSIEAKLDKFMAAQSKTNAEIMAKLERIEEILTGRTGTDVMHDVSMESARCAALGLDLADELNRPYFSKSKKRMVKP